MIAFQPSSLRTTQSCLVQGPYGDARSRYAIGIFDETKGTSQPHNTNTEPTISTQYLNHDASGRKTRVPI
jgi:hypothetical protein